MTLTYACRCHILSSSTAGNGDQKMFTLENTEGFNQSEINLLNAALENLMTSGIDEENASAIVNNNWQAAGNTVESLSEIPAR